MTKLADKIEALVNRLDKLVNEDTELSPEGVALSISLLVALHWKEIEAIPAALRAREANR